MTTRRKSKTPRHPKTSPAVEPPPMWHLEGATLPLLSTLVFRS